MGRIEVVLAGDDEEGDDLCRKYWETTGEGAFTYKVADLAKAFGLRVSDVSTIVKSRAWAIIPSYSCESCDGSFSVRSRSEFAEFLRFPKSVCTDCQAKATNEERAASQAQIATKQAEVVRLFAIVDDDISVLAADLSIRHAFGLAALLDGGEQEPTERTCPTEQRSAALGPTASFESDMIESLETAGLLRIHPATTVDAFSWEPGGAIRGYYPQLATFYLRGSGPLAGRASRFISSFEALLPRATWPDRWIAEFPGFWLQLCVGECEQYLTYELKRRGLEFTPGDKTREALRRGLQWYCLGQMYYFIWCAVRGAADYYAQGRVSKAQAANSAVTRLNGDLDRAYIQGRDVPAYNRPRALDATLWHLLMVRALGLPEPEKYSPIAKPLAALGLNWSTLSPDEFERLIFQLADEADDYEHVQWLMRTNAPDHGRDVSAVRVVSDSLGGRRTVPTVLQCKHWLARSVRDEDLAKEVVSIEHWQNPPFDVLVAVTSGRFTADAVTWAERHNAKGGRPYIELWNDAHLESLLAERQHLILNYKLR